MNEREQKSGSGVVVGCLLMAIAVPVLLYVAGYFALSKRMSGPTADSWCRCYRTKWQVEIFKPAAKVEGAITGDEVTTYWMP